MQVIETIITQVASAASLGIFNITHIVGIALAIVQSLLFFKCKKTLFRRLPLFILLGVGVILGISALVLDGWDLYVIGIFALLPVELFFSNWLRGEFIIVLSRNHVPQS